jgi:hypothetical protein
MEQQQDFDSAGSKRIWKALENAGKWLLIDRVEPGTWHQQLVGELVLNRIVPRIIPVLEQIRTSAVMKRFSIGAA